MIGLYLIQYFHSTHNNVKSSVFSFLEGQGAKFCDYAWIVFSSGANAKELSAEEKKALEQNRVIALEKKGTKFVVPDKVYRKVMVVTGRNDVDPNAPKNYLSQDDFRKDFDNKVKAVRGGSMVVRKQNF